MCRFAAYLGPPIAIDTLTTKPSHSIVKQSYQAAEREEPLNGDGFGIAWYAPDFAEPAAYRAVTPAWSDENLLHLARVTESGCILAHVRAASPGLGVSLFNCHPFLAGGLAFMHNGYLAQFPALKRPLMDVLDDVTWGSVRGSTDSEVLFALARHHLDDEGPREDRLRRALERTIALVREVSRDKGVSEAHQLNLCLTDGEAMAVTRCCTSDEAPNSLYIHHGKRYVCVDDYCQMIEPDEAGAAVLIASERLSDDAGWDRIGDDHVITVAPDRTVTVRPIAG